MRLSSLTLLAALGALVLSGTRAEAQGAGRDPVARLRAVLPADVAERVIATVTAARERGLPSQALENRALKYAARGVAPEQIERSVMEHATRMDRAQAALAGARGGMRPGGDEVDAAAEAMRMGVDGAGVSALAKSAPSGRSLAVPLFVVGSLVDRGLPSDEAIARVRDRLQSRATDAELERLPDADGPRGPRGPREGMRPGAERGGVRDGSRRPGGPGQGMPGVRGPGVPQNGGPATAPRPGGGMPRRRP
ncbi:MAG: hypothetical protein P3A32_06710 [Gemmatimonadota bacterium]|jgi:hypothetical protein|nr:hypothetical protein [Gemmatimonadota bacterium]MDQ8147856.1 hypothetical protein [Gemmatimonadota bacterium]MDQ8149500.1 hypothetical protein [Gemmatimonadota bacterium]MDQ8157288.1 hypothetical protein [Gemmatimonadota bacterium]MDQ8170927.1 hypothetical protein [Gemmatimonadota bacterium]